MEGDAEVRQQSGTFELTMPEGAHIMKVGVSRVKARLWVWVNPENELVIRKFRVLGTGCDPQAVDVADYIDTYFINERPYHLFSIH